jgi:NTP pyrophosphatase (non-canonical NTP hydrolase)
MDRKMNIREFQNMMQRIYFHRDSKRGATGTYEWLVEEVEELGEALKEKNTKAIEDEFADVLAWLASLANVTDIDLEGAATRKYDGKCPKCRQVPCNCST